MGRFLQVAGLVVMPAALIYGLQTDDLGAELLGAVVGLSLFLIGKSMSAPRKGP